MHIIKLNAIDSTNSYLRELSTSGDPEDYTVVVAREQTRGRGQMGTLWTSEPGKNLTCSVYKKIDCVRKEEIFFLSMAVSLAVLQTLKRFGIPQLKIKWPNDILSAHHKICGVLIESVIKGDRLNAAIVGIGLNVNQTGFGGLSSAGSLKSITGVHYNLDELLNRIISELKHYEGMIVGREFELLKKEYEQNLFRKDKPSTFSDNASGSVFMGFIKGISETGKLLIELEDRMMRECDLKEVKLMY
ncbi:biotin--[acetyl-CoA-carboxylase] ligase [Sinomicrobium soli]|uniref:biotin--[acetyl-CoA-carboxylase] ligase n=1 Tax=Sinomicrobium sp. N-1-3-6 TaxID=2219864 RepID=UPI000DCB6D81|nr:biotin--[acetyl-CoA-carboxylase] ligase [Sinomicrobium sp. N-1-3-6]RAV28377.1 biotin--[acetyl-CoA-carboxylase] ligase [Sinomicrobium sp. N-1-3-6]